jgi:hypothetical protein
VDDAVPLAVAVTLTDSGCVATVPGNTDAAGIRVDSEVSPTTSWWVWYTTMTTATSVLLKAFEVRDPDLHLLSAALALQ